MGPIQKAHSPHQERSPSPHYRVGSRSKGDTGAHHLNQMWEYYAFSFEFHFHIAHHKDSSRSKRRQSNPLDQYKWFQYRIQAHLLKKDKILLLEQEQWLSDSSPNKHWINKYKKRSYWYSRQNVLEFLDHMLQSTMTTHSIGRPCSSPLQTTIIPM